MIVSEGAELRIDGLLTSERSRTPKLSKNRAADKVLTLDQLAAQHIERVLQISSGRVHGKGGAAKLLGINPSTLRSRMDKLGIEYGRN